MTDRALIIASKAASSGDKEQVNHRLTSELQDRIKATARRTGLKEAEVVRAALWLALPAAEPATSMLVVSYG